MAAGPEKPEGVGVAAVEPRDLEGGRWPVGVGMNGVRNCSRLVELVHSCIRNHAEVGVHERRVAEGQCVARVGSCGIKEVADREVIGVRQVVPNFSTGRVGGRRLPEIDKHLLAGASHRSYRQIVNEQGMLRLGTRARVVELDAPRHARVGAVGQAGHPAAARDGPSSARAAGLGKT